MVTELKGGTLTSSAGDLVSPLVRPRVLGCGGLERGGVGELAVGTLLGPEGTGRPFGVGCFFVEGFMLVVPPGFGPGVWRWVLWGDSPYFENCTVDASI